MADLLYNICMDARLVDETIFKAYDIRGIYPGQIDEEIAKKIAKAYAVVIKPKGEVAVGYDVRVHSKDMAKAVREGLMESGVKVVDIGLITTDMIYFAVGNYNLAGGIQVTASHNPAEWHGMKMVGAGVKPLTGDKEIAEIKQVVLEGGEINGEGGERVMDITDEFADYMLTQLDKVQMKPMKIVINPNFGAAGKVFERIVERGKLPIELVTINMGPDGTFPKGKPDPLQKTNQAEMREEMEQAGADLGVAWDGDGDRVFFYTGEGMFVEPYYVGTFFIEDVLEKYPNQPIVYDVRYTWALQDTIKNKGGIPVIVRVGHSFIKEKMREVGAAFAVESSGHTYYRDYWLCDCGMMPVMQLIKVLAQRHTNLRDLIGPVMDKYPISGEINRRVENPGEILAEVKSKYVDGKQTELDGLSVELADFRFNIRKSNTEPLFRLNLEAKTKELVAEKTAEVLEIIGGVEA